MEVRERTRKRAEREEEMGDILRRCGFPVLCALYRFSTPTERPDEAISMGCPRLPTI